MSARCPLCTKLLCGCNRIAGVVRSIESASPLATVVDERQLALDLPSLPAGGMRRVAEDLRDASRFTRFRRRTP